MMSAIASNHILGPDDYNAVAIECRPIRSKWNTLGIYLNIADATISAIEANGNSEVFGKLTSLLSSWIRREKPTHRPSWRVLCKALEDMGERGLAETIAKKHTCRCRDCGSVIPTPLPAQSIDVLNAPVAPGVSARDIFQQHSANLANIIAVADPIRLAGEFAAVHLIVSTLVDDLNSQHALPAFQKATQIVTALHTNLKVADNKSKSLLKICEVLKKQEMPVLDNIVVKIVQQLGGPDTTTTAVPHGTNDTGTKAIVPSTTTNEQSSTTESKAAKIKSLLSGKTSAHAEKVETLRKAFDSNLKEIVDKLYKAGVISLGVKGNPSYDAIMDEFLNALKFLDDEDELAEYCGKFLEVLISIGGPTEIYGKWIRREIEKIGLRISLQ